MFQFWWGFEGPHSPNDTFIITRAPNPSGDILTRKTNAMLCSPDHQNKLF